ncbi:MULTISPECIES: hypothetical protein [Pseudoalteromonas]|uniref:Uncharacterized protein n=1 Tax=Pseudoalteromonas fuliginea TaxID=1872678 RepID=A0ABD3YC63_9GAMM|nr:MULTISPECIES: hypothetical protein [Pseudoalteromonas]ALQ10449.1 hypothetical protein D172_020500 [Pseudoalteromonas sp. Bsw20308]ATG79388.1 hypothetical protein AOR04_17650 [Pseudoalteromonas sp. 1_2015MBL_MicDiv]KAA1150946.1 hypothetical protein EU509_17735 [Pseudoalteromonas fuliginea]KAA1165619.1 hypothetical protein EUZ79_17725 [Pseudoalteromonas fuliginea]KDC52633.1 hypothetical protein DC53_03900 [Pseudoalteromonas fuliginea]
MDFYILKKQQELIAIPANENNCKQYLDSGYFYIDKVAACNEVNALKVLQTKQTKTLKYPLIMALLALPIIFVGWYSLT